MIKKIALLIFLYLNYSSPSFFALTNGNSDPHEIIPNSHNEMNTLLINYESFYSGILLRKINPNLTKETFPTRMPTNSTTLIDSNQQQSTYISGNSGFLGSSVFIEYHKPENKEALESLRKNNAIIFTTGASRIDNSYRDEFEKFKKENRLQKKCNGKFILQAPYVEIFDLLNMDLQSKNISEEDITIGEVASISNKIISSINYCIREKIEKFILILSSRNKFVFNNIIIPILKKMNIIDADSDVYYIEKTTQIPVLIKTIKEESSKIILISCTHIQENNVYYEIFNFLKSADFITIFNNNKTYNNEKTLLVINFLHDTCTSIKELNSLINDVKNCYNSLKEITNNEKYQYFINIFDPESNNYNIQYLEELNEEGKNIFQEILFKEIEKIAEKALQILTKNNSKIIKRENPIEEEKIDETNCCNITCDTCLIQ